MKRIRLISVVAVVAVVLLAGLVVAQERHRAKALGGPWRVMMSKPIEGLGHTVGELYREHEYLGAMFNQLDSQGLVPVMTQVMTQRGAGAVDEDRLLVICRQR